MSLAHALEMATASDPGMVRSHNEDSILADAALGLAVLADGMGGYNAGEVASGMATSLVASELNGLVPDLARHAGDPDRGRARVELLLRERIERVNKAIFDASQTEVQYAGMGTTLVVALFHDNRVALAHIGDSRAYRLRGDELVQITKDHSLLQEQIDSGMISPEQARYSQNKNLVTRALGIDPVVDPEIHEHATLPGDIWLLCSDGLNDMVSDEDIAVTLGALAANLELAARQLVQMANDNGGRDNVSVILVKIVRDYGAPKSVIARLLGRFR
jgi:protein phosphatase